VLERYHTIFVRAGARLDPAGKTRLAEINERLATLGTLFSQNVLADEKAWTLVLAPDDLAGLPDWLIADAVQAAADRGHAGKRLITLSRSSIEPFLQYSARRDLREKAFAAWIRRGENGGPSDNRAIMGEMIGVRASVPASSAMTATRRSGSPIRWRRRRRPRSTFSARCGRPGEPGRRKRPPISRR